MDSTKQDPLPRVPEFPRVDVIGVGVSAINRQQALDAIDAWIERDDRQYVCVTTVHGVMESQRDPALKVILNSSGLTTPDGVPLVWLSRWAGHKNVARVYGPDLMLDVCAHSVARGYRHFFYGGAPGVAEDLRRRFERRFPNIRVVGTVCPPFRPLTDSEDKELVATINRAAPDIIWIGLGAPKQEHWMAAHRAALTAPVLIGVGAAFDFHTERVKQAPSWMQRAGLEWFYRLCREPRRLARRYLVYNPLFIALMTKQYVRHLRAGRRRTTSGT